VGEQDEGLCVTLSNQNISELLPCDKNGHPIPPTVRPMINGIELKRESNNWSIADVCQGKASNSVRHTPNDLSKTSQISRPNYVPKISEIPQSGFGPKIPKNEKLSDILKVESNGNKSSFGGGFNNDLAGAGTRGFNGSTVSGPFR
jgi:hypothetical protein